MSTNTKGDKHVSTEGNRGGNKLARRARSFKEDFLDILCAMRSPGGGNTGGGGGLGSPKPPRSPKPRTSSSSDTSHEDRNPLHDLDTHVRQVQNALKHFKDVVSKNKLEVLPGNGTVVLESIATIHSVLKTYVFIEQSSTLVSATNQVYQSLAKLIKLCDDVLLGGEKALNQQNVTEVLHQVEEAVQNLVTVASRKIGERGRGGAVTEKRGSLPCEPPLRSSLPDIPLTPRERQILEQTSESHLTDTPPPKPPLPTTRVWVGDSPPPLPPKRRGCGGPPSQSLERLSLRSDTSSMGSLDSMLNTSSRDDEELRLIMDDDTFPDPTLLTHGLGSVVNGSQTSSCCWDSSCSNVSDRTQLTESPDPPATTLNNTGCAAGGVERTSTSSGFVSLRSSSQSYSYSSSTKCNTVSYQTTQQSSTTGTGGGVEVKSSSSSSTSTVTTTVTLEERTTSLPLEAPPALPVKKRSRKERQPSQYDNVHDLSSSPDTKPPPLPIKKKHIMAYMEMFGNCSQPSTSELLRHSVHTYSLLQAEWQRHQVTLSSTQSCSFNMVTTSSSPREEVAINSPSVSPAGGMPPALPPKRSKLRTPVTPPPPEPSPSPTNLLHAPPLVEPVVDDGVPNGGLTEGSPLYDLEVGPLLVFKKVEEEGPDVRGGHPDALIIHATKANKNDFLYQEAFLTTYRTFVPPAELIEKLCARHQRFSHCPDQSKQRAAREAFSLLVRVVSDLTISDLEAAVLQMLMEFVYQLLCRGELTMAKALRVKILEKHNAKLLNLATNALLSSQNIYTRQSSLMDFKSEQVAEQMTLLDSELFMKIEIPEVLIWAQEQNEERSPNLTQFTEHFNKMSYWARSRILEQNDAKERERYVVKFIKIMKHLRKINNFNSYLALLSALDSAPIRRLEWQKHITEGLKEYCALIDSSSSFRAYRQALAETQPPCIPYIGLVLQDLTFVHIGNSDYLSDGIINFSKRWQQFNIVENMKRFKKGTYSFKKNERIIAFFSNFDEFLCEEAMWQISESIKPRGSKKVNQ